MKHLILIFALLISTISFSQFEQKDGIDYLYVNFSADANNLIPFIDNPRMTKEVNGLDYDLEVGARFYSIGGYAFFGAFHNASYVNFGLGADYYPKFLNSEKLSLSIGAHTGLIFRGENKVVTWMSDHEQYFIGGRAVATYWIFDKFGISLRANYQPRPDIDTSVFEGAIGLTFRRHN